MKFGRSSRMLLGFVLILSMLFVWNACQRTQDVPTAPEPGDQTIQLSADNPQIRAVMEIQDRHTPELFKNPDIVGTATGLTEDGRPAILVFTKIPELAKGAVAEAIEGIPVVVEFTDVIRPMKSTTPGVSHTAKQTPPISLGTSGGYKYDLANGYCCGGTLGSLVTGGGKFYILSNYHVFYGDLGAVSGEPIIQPGLIDVGCVASNAQDVAKLAGNRSLPGSNVDAAIAEIIAGMVRTDGAILEIGTLSKNTVAASINQAVKKSGRTTGLTRSTVSGLNATIQVAYDTECAGAQAFVKTFTGQIVIKNKASKFLAGGDSGSLMVEDVSTNPRAVGLLFAGSSTTAIANPIGQVLSYFGVTMVGN